MGVNSSYGHISQSAIAGPCQDKPAVIRCASCILDTSPYFADLSLEAKRSIQPGLSLKRFVRRETLYIEGSSHRHLYILLSGEVKVYKSLKNGKQQIYKLVQIPGDLVASEDLYLDVHGSSAEALNDVTVCHLKCEDLQNSMAHHQEISLSLMRAMSRDLNKYIRHIANLGQKNALQRLASYLVFLSDTHEKRNLDNRYLKILLSRVELADLLGVTQRTLIRSIKQLESENLIKHNREGFSVLDLSTLEQISLCS